MEPTVVPKRFWRVGRQTLFSFHLAYSREKVQLIALKSVNLIQSSLDCRANVEQFNHQCFERSVKICERPDIEVKKPRIKISLI
jgi:hypothetical protein